MEAIALYCELDRQWEVAEVLASLAYRHWFLSDYEGAKELMEKSRGIRRRACCWPTCTARNTMYQGPEARPLIASSTLDALLPTAKPIVVRRSRSLVQAEKAIALAPEAAYLLFLAWLVLMVTIGGAFHLLNGRIDDLSLSLPSPETVLLPDGIVPAVNFGCYPRSGPAPLTKSCADFTPGPIQARHWDFGDGSEGCGLVTSHTYSVAGEYTVSLVVNSPDAGVSKGWRKSYIVVAPKPPVGAADDE